MLDVFSIQIPDDNIRFDEIGEIIKKNEILNEVDYSVLIVRLSNEDLIKLVSEYAMKENDGFIDWNIIRTYGSFQIKYILSFLKGATINIDVYYFKSGKGSGVVGLLAILLSYLNQFISLLDSIFLVGQFIAVVLKVILKTVKLSYKKYLSRRMCLENFYHINDSYDSYYAIYNSNFIDSVISSQKFWRFGYISKTKIKYQRKIEKN